MADNSTSICPPDTAPRPVENSDLYILFQLTFILAYFGITLLCVTSIYQFWAEQRKQGQRLHMSNNRLQVITALGVGSFVRGLSFISLDCVGEELTKTIKDIAFLTAFTLIVLFWVELQTYVRNMQSISKLRPALLACIGTYSIFRLFAMIFNILQMTAAKNIMTGLTIIVYLGVMGVGIYYGRLLLMKMKSMKKGDMKSRLKKLTYFIILEGVIYLLFLISWGIRQSQGKLKRDGPETWFWLKAWEKLLEFFGNLVLCLTMTTSSKKGAKASGERERKRTISNAAGKPRRDVRDGSTASSEPVNGADKLAGPEGTVGASGGGAGLGRAKPASGGDGGAAGAKGVDGDSAAVRVGIMPGPGESKAAPGRLNDTINPLLPEGQARRPK